ncbi:MAG: zinc ABC transporter substrate-binding protein [Alphaproteobacteria bacterium]|nr:zinc ABC transporter substrate-binding protein [Alphaproteobacteria bacterium]
MRPALSVLAAALALAVLRPAAAEVPSVVASIPPVHSLVAAVMVGVGTPALLIPGAVSEHTYTLKPSDARLLDRAGVVFWVGPPIEGYLAKPLAALAGRARVVELLDADGVERLPARSGGVWESHDYHDKSGDELEDHGDDATTDGHVWLAPANARAIGRAAAVTLSAADPANAARYAANLATLEARLVALDDDLRAVTAPVRGLPFIVFHDAYQYLERAYTLASAGSITVSAERKPGAQRLAELRAKVREARARCVFAEPQFPSALVRTVAEGTGARTASLDQLGAGIAPGPELYFTMMRRLAGDLAFCLRG